LQTLSDENPALNAAILANAALVHHLIALLVPGADGRTSRISACALSCLLLLSLSSAATFPLFWLMQSK
jgi:hypothetical protein